LQLKKERKTQQTSETDIDNDPKAKKPIAEGGGQVKRGNEADRVKGGETKVKDQLKKEDGKTRQPIEVGDVKNPGLETTGGKRSFQKPALPPKPLHLRELQNEVKKRNEEMEKEKKKIQQADVNNPNGEEKTPKQKEADSTEQNQVAYIDEGDTFRIRINIKEISVNRTTGKPTNLKVLEEDIQPRAVHVKFLVTNQEEEKVTYIYKADLPEEIVPPDSSIVFTSGTISLILKKANAASIGWKDLDEKLGNDAEFACWDS